MGWTTRGHPEGKAIGSLAFVPGDSASGRSRSGQEPSTCLPAPASPGSTRALPGDAGPLAVPRQDGQVPPVGLGQVPVNRPLHWSLSGVLLQIMAPDSTVNRAPSLLVIPPPIGAEL